MRKKVRDFRDLDVWNKGKDIALGVYRVTKTFPPEELYGLVSQMRRAAVSIPANIAEGFNRMHNKEYRQFLHVALGSCAELETHVEIAGALGYLGLPDRAQILEQLDHETRMLRNLANKVVARTP
ncbi:MAG: four helix bundle protein [Nitrospirae bacterium]|nr:four helix bundle protein [Nitrospirota bacterium]